MNDESVRYIEISHLVHRPVRIDTLLEKRMKEFMLMRRRKVWKTEDR